MQTQSSVKQELFGAGDYTGLNNPVVILSVVMIIFVVAGYQLLKWFRG